MLDSVCVSQRHKLFLLFALCFENVIADDADSIQPFRPVPDRIRNLARQNQSNRSIRPSMNKPPRVCVPGLSGPSDLSLTILLILVISGR